MSKPETHTVTSQQSNQLAAAFREAIRPTPCLFTMGFEFSSERITAKLPHLVAVALLAANVKTSARQFQEVAAVLQLLVREDAASLTAPLPQPAPPLPELFPWD